MSVPNRASALLRSGLVSRPVVSATAAPRTSKRFAHRRVPLPYDAEHGLPGFLSPNALRTVAVDWQEGVLHRLDELVRGTELEEKSVLQTLKEAAQDPTRTLAFNYASEALNNSFFLSTLSPTPSGPTPSSSFSTKLAQTPSLGSFPALVSHFSAHVSGLHPSSGAYVWLVTDPSGNLGVVGTYAGGTVLVKERAQTGYGSYAGKDLRVLGEQVQVVDDAAAATTAEAPAATGSGEQAEGASATSAWHAVTPARSSTSSNAHANGGLDVSSSAQEIMQASRQSSAALAASVGSNLHPLACISVHPHCYLEDYGLWGRDEYVKKWWGAVDWTKVEQAYDAFTTRAKATR